MLCCDNTNQLTSQYKLMFFSLTRNDSEVLFYVLPPNYFIQNHKIVRNIKKSCNLKIKYDKSGGYVIKITLQILIVKVLILQIQTI